MTVGCFYSAKIEECNSIIIISSSGLKRCLFPGLPEELIFRINSLVSQFRQLCIFRMLNKGYFVVFQFSKTLVVTKIIDPFRFRGAYAGEIIESKPFFLQIAFWCRNFTLRTEGRKDKIVLFKNPVNRIDYTVWRQILLVVVCTPALITAEFLVCPTS